MECQNTFLEDDGFCALCGSNHYQQAARLQERRAAQRIERYRRWQLLALLAAGRLIAVARPATRQIIFVIPATLPPEEHQACLDGAAVQELWEAGWRDDGYLR